MDKPAASKMWDKITREHINQKNLQNLESFKSGLINFRIVLFDPAHYGLRYLKEFIFYLASTLNQREWEILQRIPNRQVGRPFTVRFNGEEVCMDYLHAVFELSFLSRRLDLEGCSVVEIGAGYGRTCHALMSNFALDSYTIIDLEEVLALSRWYLERVLPPEQYARVRFRDTSRFLEVQAEEYDLGVNIDSFSEMEPETVRLYLDFIDQRCRWFYTKNPVGKYRNPELLRPDVDLEAVEHALGAGVLRDVIDIHDMGQVRAQRDKFVSAYRPGASWERLADDWARLWSHFWQALYAKP